jgi:hypothetical protein
LTIPSSHFVSNRPNYANYLLLVACTGSFVIPRHQECARFLHPGDTKTGKCSIAWYSPLDAIFNYPTLAECYKVATLDAANKLSA